MSFRKERLLELPRVLLPWTDLRADVDHSLLGINIHGYLSLVSLRFVIQSVSVKYSSKASELIR